MSSKITSFESEIAFIVPLATDLIRFLDVSCFFELSGIPIPVTRHAILSRFLQEKFISVEYSGYGITNLGALLFANNLANFPQLRTRAFHIVQYSGIDQSNVSKVHLGNLGYAKGFKPLLNYIQKHFSETSLIDLDVASLVNQLIVAIVSQDFSKEQSGPLIEIYADRVEIVGSIAGDIYNTDFQKNIAVKNPLLFEAIQKLRLNSVEFLTNNSTKTHN